MQVIHGPSRKPSHRTAVAPALWVSRHEPRVALRSQAPHLLQLRTGSSTRGVNEVGKVLPIRGVSEMGRCVLHTWVRDFGSSRPLSSSERVDFHQQKREERTTQGKRKISVGWEKMQQLTRICPKFFAFRSQCLLSCRI